jgi:hypothetical protein
MNLTLSREYHSLSGLETWNNQILLEGGAYGEAEGKMGGVVFQCPGIISKYQPEGHVKHGDEEF